MFRQDRALDRFVKDITIQGSHRVILTAHLQLATLFEHGTLAVLHSGLNSCAYGLHITMLILLFLRKTRADLVPYVTVVVPHETTTAVRTYI